MKIRNDHYECAGKKFNMIGTNSPLTVNTTAITGLLAVNPAAAAVAMNGNLTVFSTYVD